MVIFTIIFIVTLLVIGAGFGGLAVYYVLCWAFDAAMRREQQRYRALAEDYQHLEASHQTLQAAYEIQRRKETPEEWRERNLRTKYEQIEHDIRASELAFRRHIDKLTRLKQIRDAALRDYPDLKEDIEVGFEIYRRKDAKEIIHDGGEQAEEEQRY